MHEAKMYDQNAFITLTYDPEKLPADYSLDLRHWQLFMKRLRKSLRQRLRFFACGEYGEENGRPHYHAIIFNHQFPDLKHYKTINDQQLFTSTTLTNLWQLGHCTTGSVTFQSAGYVSRYCTKKINGDDVVALQNYYRFSPVDREWHFVKPEFAVMSRRPGIGHTWLQEFRSDVFPSGFIVVNGVKQSLPRYYVSQLSEEEQEIYKRAQRAKARHFKPHTTTERRWARKAVRDARISQLKRGL